ncbi:hypothetical protein HME9304_02122 [Flagellimonas maritima]|uniref:Uncharacterized protein n=1 Tax=Flagellimonas maritima TaxID=1383885 RepID=A0A2Z4LTN8_9FLAO|nr:hypothetical protein HME9304_02122 [Allomuricauda aurantiaca]
MKTPLINGVFLFYIDVSAIEKNNLYIYSFNKIK